MDQEKLSQNKQILHSKALCWRDWKIILPRITHNLFLDLQRLWQQGVRSTARFHFSLLLVHLFLFTVWHLIYVA